MSDTTAMAGQVADLIGGPKNVSSVQTCATRLRFVVKDRSDVRMAQLQQTPGVVQVVESAGQVQVVIGTQVETVRDALLALPGWGGFADSGTSASSGRPVDRVFDFLSGTFQPLLYPLIGAAMLKVALTLLTQLQWLDPAGPTGLLLAAASNALFYFLPIFVGFTASRKLGANPYLGATITAALLEPNFLALGASGDVTRVLGLPLYLFGYASTMFPALLAALALAATERVLKRVLPQSLHLLLVPAIALTMLVPVTALVFGPIGVLLGNAVASGVTWLGATVPLLFYVVVAATWVFMVSLGLHWAVLPIVIVELTTTGSSGLFAAAGGYQFAMIGAALGVFLKSRHDAPLRLTSGAALAAAAVGGVTEPTLYGLVLRYKRVLVAEVIGAAAAGLVLGLFTVTGSAIVLAPILGIPSFSPVVGYVIALAVGVGVTTTIILLRGYQSPKDAARRAASAESTAPAPRPGTAPTVTRPVLVGSPVEGTVVPLSQVPDPIFAANLLGGGVAIAPTADRVVATLAGVVVVAPESGHAVGIRSDDGIELLVHVGIDTVKMGGVGFRLAVAPGDRVHAGQVLLTFDREAIARAGHSLLTPVIVTNGAALGPVQAVTEGDVAEGAPLLSVEPRTAAVA